MSVSSVYDLFSLEDSPDRMLSLVVGTKLTKEVTTPPPPLVLTSFIAVRVVEDHSA